MTTGRYRQERGTAPKVCAVLATILGPRHEAARHTRSDEILACVRSLLANTYDGPFEVVVVDQSKDDTVARALHALRQTEPRLRYIHTDTPGMARAQNMAVASSDADIFAFTDDDCIVPPDWIARIVAIFSRHPDAGVVFSDVQPPVTHDWAVSYVPEIHFPEERCLRPAFLPRVNNLMGANMAVSRRAFARIGLFDERLGPGGSSGAYNVEVELHIRALRAHPPVAVYMTPAFPVVHEHGSRPQGEPARRLLRTYHVGKSAILTKHALRGDAGAACKLALLAFEPVVEGMVNLVRTGRPRGIGMVGPYFEGIGRGLRIVRGRVPRLVETE